MDLPNNILPASNDELIHMLGLDDGLADNNKEIDFNYRASRNGTSSTGINYPHHEMDVAWSSFSIYNQESVLHGHNPAGINHPLHEMDLPWNSYTNFNHGSALTGHNPDNQDGYFGSDINMLVEDLITDLDRSDEVLQDGYPSSNTNKLLDDVTIDHDLNSYLQTFAEVPSQTSRFESMHDGQELMDNFLMAYQPTEIISYVDMSEPCFDDSLY